MEEKLKGREDDVEGGIWPTQKFWRCAPYARARPLAGFIPAAPRWEGEKEGGERNGKGEEGQKGRKVEGQLEQGRGLAKAGPG